MFLFVFQFWYKSNWKQEKSAVNALNFFDLLWGKQAPQSCSKYTTEYLTTNLRLYTSVFFKNLKSIKSKLFSSKICADAYYNHLLSTIKRWVRYCICIDTRKRAPKNNEINSKVKRPLWEQRNMLGARIKIMWEEQLVDPLNNYITSVIPPWFLVVKDYIVAGWIKIVVLVWLLGFGANHGLLFIVQYWRHHIETRQMNVKEWKVFCMLCTGNSFLIYLAWYTF